MEQALDKEKVAAIKSIRPGFNKSLYSMFYRRLKYGIAPDREVKKYLAKLYPGQPIPGEPEKKPVKRKNSEYVGTRTTKRLKADLLKALKEDGFGDMASGLHWLIEMYLIRRKTNVETAGDTARGGLRPAT